MNSKECLKKEIDYLEFKKQAAYKNEYYSIYRETEEKINNLKQVLQDLDKLEKLEKVIEILKKFSNEYYFDGNYLIADNGEAIKIDYSQYELLKEVLENDKKRL